MKTLANLPSDLSLVVLSKTVEPADARPKFDLLLDVSDETLLLLTHEWDESKHPRAEDGKWTDGSGSGNSWEGTAEAVVKAGKGTIRYTDKSGNILGSVQHTGGPNQPWWATDHTAEPISKHATAKEAKAAVEAFVKKLKKG